MPEAFDGWYRITYPSGEYVLVEAHSAHDAVYAKCHATWTTCTWRYLGRKKPNMGTKDNPGEFDCYALALPDEPIFVLRANNEEAAPLVEQWADKYEQRKRKEGTYDRRAARKVKEALQIAEEMRTYRSLMDTVVPPPLPGSPPSEPKPGEVTAYDPATRTESRAELSEVTP